MFGLTHKSFFSSLESFLECIRKKKFARKRLQTTKQLTCCTSKLHFPHIIRSNSTLTSLFFNLHTLYLKKLRARSLQETTKLTSLFHIRGFLYSPIYALILHQLSTCIVFSILHNLKSKCAKKLIIFFIYINKV